jgi:hypothetical protein
VIIQVRNTIHFLSIHFKNYQQEVWDLINNFDAFNISHVPSSLNYDENLLANVASKLIPLEGIMFDTFSVEPLYRPSVPNNITNWRFFDYNQQITSFLHIEDKFKYFVIDEGQHDQDVNYGSPKSIRQVVGRKVTPIKNIPKNW